MTAVRRAAPPRFAALAVVAGLVAAATMDAGRLGLNVVLVAVALALAGRATWRGPRDRWSHVWTALALGLAALSLLRDAGWVVVPSLLAACAFGSLALAGGAHGRALLCGLGGVFAWLPAGAITVARSAAPALPRVASSRLSPVLRGLVLAAGLVAVFTVLFASGDRAFAEIAQRALPSSADFGSLPGRAVWFVVVLALAGAFAAASGTGAQVEPYARAARQLTAIEWGIALTALNALFAAFVAVQASVLFGRHDHVLETAGLTYAEYAHSGFAQLIVAALLTLGVVGAAGRWARAETTRARIALRVLLVCLCGFTLVILASALHRLDLYQDAYGATRLRVAAVALAWWVGAVLVLAVAAQVVRGRAWFARVCALLTGLTVLAFGLSDPDARVANRNVDRFEQTGRLDVTYLNGLSADAVPAIERLLPRLRARALPEEPAGDSWATFNLARHRARSR